MTFTFGIEEEFFVVNRKTRTTMPRMPARFLRRCEGRLGPHVSHEMLQSQIEATTPVCHSMGQARAELTRLRGALAGEAGALGLAIVAAGTLPLVEWREQRHTGKPRYEGLMDDLRMLGRRNAVCGLHVHVELPDPDRRIDVMRRLLPYLPILLALSTSSPFWGRLRTGLLGYRLAAYDELPRTGLPPRFQSAADYGRYVDTLVEAGVIGDGSYLWWAVRPSVRFPTLELRVADSCTRLEDALSVAAIYRCLVRRLFLDPSIDAMGDAVAHAVADENLWRAKRYGVRGSLIDPARRTLVPVREMVDSLLRLIAEDAAVLDCRREVEHARAIIHLGTSAEAQLAVFAAARADGLRRLEALRSVVDWLMDATVAGAPAAAVA